MRIAGSIDVSWRRVATALTERPGRHGVPSEPRAGGGTGDAGIELIYRTKERWSGIHADETEGKIAEFRRKSPLFVVCGIGTITIA